MKRDGVACSEIDLSDFADRVSCGPVLFISSLIYHICAERVSCDVVLFISSFENKQWGNIGKKLIYKILLIGFLVERLVNILI